MDRPQAVSPESLPASVTVLESSDQGILLEFSAPDFLLSTQSLEGKLGDLVKIAGADRTSEPGKPELPVVNTLLGVPAKVKIDLEIVEDQPEILPGRYVITPVPSPQPITDDLQAGQYSYTRDAATYQQDALYPDVTVRIGSDAWLRDQRLVRLEFTPFQYNPLQELLIRHARLKVRLRFTSDLLDVTSSFRLESPGSPSPFEPLLQRSLLNYTEARQWRAQPIPAVHTLEAAASNPRYRIAINQDGIYRMTYETLQAAGLPVTSLNPTTFQLSNQGQEVALMVTNLDGDTNKFGPGEAVIFYGQKFTGQRMAQRYAAEDDLWISFTKQLTDGSYALWKPELNALMFEKYTDVNVYWLSYGGLAGKRMASEDGTPGSASLSPSYRATARAEQQRIWKTTHFTNEDTFFWDRLQTASILTRTYTTTLTAPVSGVISATLRGEVVAAANDDLHSPDHHTRFLLNPSLYPKSVVDAIWDGKSRYHFEAQVPQTALVNGTNQLSFSAIKTPYMVGDDLYFDWFEIEYDRLYQASGDNLAFSTSQAGNWKFALSGFTASEVMLLDVTRPLSPTQVMSYTYAGGVATFQSSLVGDEQFFAGKLNDLTPAQVAVSILPDLLSTANAADYMIITHHDFITESRLLADYRLSQGFKPLVVDVADLYDLFTDGIYHPIAIKNFLAYAVGYWQTPPEYVVLVGDGTWNLRGYSTYTNPKIYMPPYLAWVDPWQGEIDSANLLANVVGNDPLADVYIGRMPVNSVQELHNIITKIIAYEEQPPQSWQRRSLFVTDNTPDDAGDFVQMAENVITTYATPGFSYDRIYENNYGCTSGLCPQVNRAITQTLNITGTLLINYIGHGSNNRWSGEQIFMNANIPTLNNGGMLPIVLSMTCLDGYWYFPGSSGLMEDMLRAANKGSVASFSPTGLGVSTGHDLLHSGFYKTLFQDGIWELGKAEMGGKLKLFAAGQYFDLLHTFTIFGDPALQILNANNPYQFSVESGPMTMSGYKGFPVEYILTVNNTGIATDTYTVFASSSQWPVNAPYRTVSVPPGGSINIPIWVTIPASAQINSSDQATITVVSLGSRIRNATTQIMTTAVGARLALPLLGR